jgi:release factor glutamine methyltransferase
MAALDREVAGHDPRGALHGGQDGLDPYRIIIPNASTHLKAGGWLGVEIGYDQGEDVSQLFNDAGYEAISLIKDPAGLDRVVCGNLPSL